MITVPAIVQHETYPPEFGSQAGLILDNTAIRILPHAPLRHKAKIKISNATNYVYIGSRDQILNGQGGIAPNSITITSQGEWWAMCPGGTATVTVHDERFIRP